MVLQVDVHVCESPLENRAAAPADVCRPVSASRRYPRLVGSDDRVSAGRMYSGALGAADHVEVNLPRFRECFTAERERVGHGNDSSKMSMIRVIVRTVGYCRLAAVTLLWLIQVRVRDHCYT